MSLVRSPDPHRKVELGAGMDGGLILYFLVFFGESVLLALAACCFGFSLYRQRVGFRVFGLSNTPDYLSTCAVQMDQM